MLDRFEDSMDASEGNTCNATSPSDEKSANGSRGCAPLLSFPTTRYAKDNDDKSNGNHNRASKGNARRSLGKMSVMLLTLGVLLELGVSHVYRLDASSKDSAKKEQHPALRFFQQKPPPSSKPRVRLGSAAIASITDALSPILPFAGGLDLRRSDWATWYERIESLASQAHDAVSWVGAPATTPAAHTQRHKQQAPRARKHANAVSRPKPFMPHSEIAELTLGEVTEGFRYAVQSSKAGFSESGYKKKSPRVTKLIRYMKDAVAESRGKHVMDSRIERNVVASGNVDALKFGAAVRIFAEWRVLRQVPEGYKGYAVGMGLGQKDVVQNLEKMEQAIHELIDFQRDEAEAIEQAGGRRAGSLRTPTLRELMQHEINTNIHPRLPRLKEKSAGMGLLWVRRQIQYQTGVFDNILQVPRKFKDTEAAVAGAYKEVYDRFHGWAVQKIFNYSFQSAPDAAIIYRHMNPHRLKDVVAEAKEFEDHGDILTSSSATQDSAGIMQWVYAKSKEQAEYLATAMGLAPKREIQDHSAESLEVARERFVTEEMIKDAHIHINNYLEVARPLLSEIADVFDEMNMNDPNKV